MGDWDPTILVALISMIGVVISSFVGVLASQITSRKETERAANQAAVETAKKAEEEKEEALQALLLLKSEEAASVRRRNEDLVAENKELRAEIVRLKAGEAQ